MNLNPKLNLPSRQDSLEGHNYANGVKNAFGKVVIRALNEEELDFLDKFEAETVITDFYHTKDLKDHKKALDKAIKDHARSFIGQELEGLIILSKEIDLIEDEDLKYRLACMIERRIKKCRTKTLSSKDSELVRIFLAKYKPNANILKVSEQLDTIKERDNLYSRTEDQQDLYNENNRRNNDLYNYSKVNRTLDNFEVTEFDLYTSDVTSNIDHEFILIKEIETKILCQSKFNLITDSIFVDKQIFDRKLKPVRKRSKRS